MFDFRSLNDGKIAIFAGAGISRDSGLPLAIEVKKSILINLIKNKSDIKEIMRADMPFEYFVQNLNVDKSEQLFNFFNYGEPNTNHILIAKLAKIGIVKTILTTNFDLLFEKALTQEGLEFSTYCDDEEIQNINWQNFKNEINIFKIHGSIEKYDSLKNTLNSVGQGLTTCKRKVIDYVFSEGSHNKIIVLGYSCSDKFDINSYLYKLRNKPKKVIFIQHNDFNQIIPRELTELGTYNPFCNFNGCLIKCNTRVFIKNFWKFYEDEIGPFIDQKFTFDWERHLKAWYDYINSNGLCDLISGQLFHSISKYEKAKKYYMKCLKIVEEKEIPFGIYQCHLLLGNVNQKLSLYSEAISHYNNAFIVAMAFESDNTIETKEAHCYANLGNLFVRINDFTQAIINLEIALEIYKKLKIPIEESRVCMSLGYCYLETKDFENALSSFEHSLKIKRSIGDFVGIANSYGSLGRYYNAINEPLKSLEYNRKSIEYYKDLDMKNEIGSSYINLSKSYNNLGKIKEELECLREAEKIFVQLRIVSNLIFTLECIIDFACRENDMGLQKECEKKIKILNSGKFYSFVY
jgi:tetratricopeptide (TPR) repeat protein/NAD-dependent SIR2 family protein deacetylase